ncbi:aminotransferase class III-fold pyridoxal phosphate-dependent enzyme [Methylocapsa palsarum]|uniref:Acetylornithine/N-succinyldiaminopimelate aminotransferase n=1 Tax=Methylocapsa palsarum TaxID=1612308 RepID=A0A1I4A4Y6_9HYPH|nr:aminotransferase class III-fold pyridoxal phosphate-dependent enzyme [Methylocapsa palsarum]SFK51398.1 acetylornithine/N-succinyldiaminopimelate aminotransferase [Methylocapsa palsarum]
MSGSSPSPPGAAEILEPPSDDGAYEARQFDFSGAFGGVEASVAQAADPPDAAALSSGLDQEAPGSAGGLIEKLIALSFGDRAFLLPSEAVAWRTAIDAIRRSHQAAGRPKRRRLIVCAGASAASGPAPAGLEGDDEVTLLQTDDLGALSGAIKPNTAGVLIAPVRTGNGLDVLDGRLLAGLREMADEYGLVLAFDETFCGLGRSGMVWAHEWTGVTPDLMISTRGLGNSLPLAALVATRKVAQGAPANLPPADPAAIAAAHAMMDVLSAPGFEERVQNRAWRLEDRLGALVRQRSDMFKGLRGVGLMQGLLCAREAEPLRAKLAERGLLTRVMGSVLGIFPPLSVEESDIDLAVDILAEVCAGEGA